MECHKGSDHCCVFLIVDCWSRESLGQFPVGDFISCTQVEHVLSELLRWWFQWYFHLQNWKISPVFFPKKQHFEMAHAFFYGSRGNLSSSLGFRWRKIFDLMYPSASSASKCWKAAGCEDGGGGSGHSCLSLMPWIWCSLQCSKLSQLFWRILIYFVHPSMAIKGYVWHTTLKSL